MVSSLTQADVARLLAEPSAAVRAEVAHKLALEIDNTALSEAEIELANDIVRIMARDVEATVRRALSENLRRARHLPHDVALRLANDVEAVALPILSDSPVLTDADLVAIVRQGPSRKQEAVANRDEISEQVSDALITAGSEAAVATLMANESARIAEAALDTAINRFADSERVKESIVHRANLPATISERLVVMVSDRLQLRHETARSVAASGTSVATGNG